MTQSYINCLKAQETIWRHRKAKKPKKPRAIDKYTLTFLKNWN